MDSKTKELVAVGAAMAVNCAPCLEFHVEKAKACGASRKELIIASAIGVQVKFSAAQKMEEHASTVIQGFGDEKVEKICRCE